MRSQHPLPSPDNEQIQASFLGQDARTFVVALDKGKLNFKITRKALREFETEGLLVMDECLMSLTERLTPANEPDRRPDPLTLLSHIMMDGLNASDAQTMMICVLWLGHHYPAITGIQNNGGAFEFSWTND